MPATTEMMQTKTKKEKRKAASDASSQKAKRHKLVRSSSEADARQLEEAMKMGLFTLLLNRLPADGPQLSAMAKRSLLRGKATVTIMKQDPNLCMKNDVLGLWDSKTTFFRENSASLLMSCLKRRGLSLKRDFDAIKSDPALRCTALFLSFERHPEIWLDTLTDPCFDEHAEPTGIAALEGPDEVEQFMQDSMKAKFVDYRKCNTRFVEQDTDYHRVDNSVSALILGDVNAVANTLAPRNLTYAEACDRTVRSIFGMRSDADIAELGKNFKRSNDFPVLVGLDTLKFVRGAGDKVYAVDFFEKSKALGKPLVPLLLTSATEVILRVQLQYMNVLYRAGCVLLNPEPLETNDKVSLHGLDDGDQNSVLMNLVRSDSFLYAVCVHCSDCTKTFNQLWKPGVEAVDSNWLSGCKCDSCGCALEDLSAFVMRDAPSRQSLDPASMRHLQWEVPVEKKQPLLPTDVASKADLAKFECVAPQGGVANMRVHLSADYPRKNQRTSTVAVTMYVPVAFDMESTLQDMRHRIPGMDDPDIKLEVADSNQHVVNAYTFLGDKEHRLTLTLTRVKLTLTCNKKSVPAVVSRDKLLQMKCQLPRVKNTLGVQPIAEQPDKFQVTVDMPAVQTNKRIGVQTIHPVGVGMALEHTSKVLLAPASRINRKRQKQAREEEEGTMYSALNFWCHPNWTETNNFMRYGPSMIAGLVYNMHVQGKFRLADGEDLQLLPMGSYKWIDLQQLDGCMSQQVAQYLYGNKKLELVNQVLKVKEDVIKEQQMQISQFRQEDRAEDIQKVQKKLAESEQLVSKLRVEKERLERENKNLHREIRTMARTIAKLEENLESNMATMQNQDARLDALERKLEEVLQGGNNVKQEGAHTQQTETDLVGFVDNYDLGEDLDSMFQSWYEALTDGSGTELLADLDLLDLASLDIPEDLKPEAQPQMVVSCA